MNNLGATRVSCRLVMMSNIWTFFHYCIFWNRSFFFGWTDVSYLERGRQVTTASEWANRNNFLIMAKGGTDIRRISHSACKATQNLEMLVVIACHLFWHIAVQILSNSDKKKRLATNMLHAYAAFTDKIKKLHICILYCQSLEFIENLTTKIFHSSFEVFI